MTVYLVGAGPGDPGLLTVRAKELIETADVILHDRLIPPGILESAQGECIYVGKIGEGEQTGQDEINALLVEHGRSGLRIVRLKGGDPFVFGRGGEEAQVLRAAGIRFEVVPGVTAGVAAPAYAGIPVTQRQVSSAVAFVAGHEDPGKPGTALDWEALARFPGTLVFYMGVRGLPRIASALIDGGRPATEPVAVVERGTLPGQRTLIATLGDVAERAEAAGIRAPAITLVGDVAALGEEIGWLGSRPLHGRTIAVTRARAQASELAATLRELGADVIEAPTIRTEPIDATLPPLYGYDLVVFTSPNGVREFFARQFERGRDARDLRDVAAIGPGTAAALREHGVLPDVVPERAIAEGLVDALANWSRGPGAPAGTDELPVERVLIVRAREGRDVLGDALRERGAEVDLLVLYETIAEQLSAETVAAAGGADYVTFTSASTVRNFVAAGGSLDGPRLASIGPATSAALREHGAEPHLEADPHTPDGLVEALLRDAAS